MNRSERCCLIQSQPNAKDELQLQQKSSVPYAFCFPSHLQKTKKGSEDSVGNCRRVYPFSLRQFNAEIQSSFEDNLIQQD